MPRFIFDQIKKVKIREPVEEEPVLSPSVISKHPTESIVTPPIAAEAIVKSRKTRPVDRSAVFACVVVFIPLAVLAFLLVTDSFSRDFCSAQLHRWFKDDRGAVALFSSALKNRADDIALKERADCYLALGDKQRERADLWTLVQNKTYDPLVYPRSAIAEAREGNLSNAVYAWQKSVDHERPKGCFSWREEATYNFLLLGALEKSKELLKEISVPSNEASQMRQILQSLIYRESGDSKRALETISAVHEKYLSTFKDSRLKYDKKNVRLSIQALLRLDNNEPKEARALLEQLLPLPKQDDKSDESEPILDVLQGWLLLEEGRLTECLKLTESALKVEDLDKNIVGLNLKAALHLIRKDVFLRQKQTEQAATEARLYAQSHCSGLVFTPVCLRSVSESVKPESKKPSP